MRGFEIKMKIIKLLGAIILFLFILCLGIITAPFTNIDDDFFKDFKNEFKKNLK